MLPCKGIHEVPRIVDKRPFAFPDPRAHEDGAGKGLACGGCDRSIQARGQARPEAAEAAPRVAIHCMPAGIGGRQRSVVDIAVPIERLAVERVGHDGVRRHESAERRIVESRVGVDLADGVHHLVAGVAAGGGGCDGAGGVVGAVAVAAAAPGVVAEAFGDGAGAVGHHRDRAQVIEHEVHPGGSATDKLVAIAG